MFQIFRQAARSLAMRPGFSLLVLLILALCIGGNAAVYSAAKAVLFRELPYKDVDRLVILSMWHLPNASETDLSWPEAMDWKRQTKLLDDVSPFLCWQNRLLIRDGSVDRIGVNLVPSTYFKLLEARPQLGRLFTPQEDAAAGGAPVMILSHHLWERMFAKDPAILGKQLRLNRSTYTVVGVMQPGFYDFTQGRWPVDAWVPAAQVDDAFPEGPPIWESRNDRFFFALAKLKPGTSIEQAQQEADSFAEGMQKAYPDTNRDYGARVTPLREFMFVDLFDGVKLLIGCANIANLLLARLAERQRELSLRLALGANRTRLVQHVLAESLILAIVGGALGLLVAAWGTKLLASLVDLPPFTRMELDPGAVVVTTIAAVVTGILFGLPPALSVARMDSTGTLQQIRAAGSRTHTTRGRSGLLVFQVAIVVVLLVVAGLLMRSFWRLQTTGVDLQTDSLLTMRIAFESERLQTERGAISLAAKELLKNLEATPGVEGAAIWGPGMPGIVTVFTEVKKEGAAATAAPIRADLHVISPGALELLGVNLLQGQGFTGQENRDTERVIIINKSLADNLWPGQNPIGKRLNRTDRENDPMATVVGIIPDTRFQGRFVQGNHHAIFSAGQLSPIEQSLLVRTSIDAESLTQTVRRAVREIDPLIPVYDVLTLEQRLRREEASQRLNATVVGLYSVLALLLALLGLYGMLAYSVVQRTQEIGVRMALGANHNRVLGMVMSKGYVIVGAGLVLGLVGAFLLTRLLSTLLFGITATDPVTFVGVIVVFLGVASLATYLPARRAVRVEPTIALRYE
jgi:putative ABC transport system permease protein